MFKKHIVSLKRYQTSENRDVLNGIILDRNERAEPLKPLWSHSDASRVPKVCGIG